MNAATPLTSKRTQRSIADENTSRRTAEAALSDKSSPCPRKNWKLLRAAMTVLVTLISLPAIGQQTPPPEHMDESDNPYVWKPHTTSVAVFKNGLGFFLREGEANLRNGWCMAKPVPPAAFGTLAIYSHANNEMVDIVGSGPGEIVDFDDRDTPKTIAAKRSRLSAAKQLKVALTYKHKGTDLTAAGELVSVGPEFVVLEGQSNNFAVTIESISRMQILDLPLRVHVAGEDKDPPTKTRLGMAYLRKGITWIPEYTLKVIDDRTAELTLRGTLVNEAEDLIHCDVNFVVGVPHFRHTDYLAPIAVGQIIRTIGAAVAPKQIMTQITNRAAIASNRAGSGRFGRQPPVVDTPHKPETAKLNDVFGNLPQLPGPAATDYTVYTKKNLTVRRGEKAIVTLFVKKIEYSHLYRWTPPDQMRHFLVLDNNTDTAWTTGPCLAISSSRPLSEDLLTYTPKGGKAELPVTVAVNLAHKKMEMEIDRKLKAHQPRRDHFLDLVILKGELKLRNFEKTAARIVIEVPVPGKPVTVSDQGTLFTDPSKLKLAERSGTVRWTITLEPGQTRTLTYKYERYVPST